jgi:tRNA U34 2-thiouridine synthase MnmA/TrmU
MIVIHIYYTTVIMNANAIPENNANSIPGKIKAVALMSGGLDSNLAVRLIHDMGIEVSGVHFTGPFCMCNRGTGGCIFYAKKIAAELGIEFSTRNLGEEYLRIVTQPEHGYGSGMNPCLDCRIMMFRKAKEMMEKAGASFIMTGEVLGQRPMSQLRDKLRIIERDSGLKGLILRPLSARHLPPTKPEKDGLVNREKLLDIRGRGRRPQIELADRLELGDYPCPAGGCLLTDKHFSERLREHLEHAGNLQMTHIAKLKLGRHFRLPSGAKLIVGRDQQENEKLENLVDGKSALLTPLSVKGPAAALMGSEGPGRDIQLAAEILAAYCKDTQDVRIAVRQHAKTSQISVQKRSRDRFSAMKT